MSGANATALVLLMLTATASAAKPGPPDPTAQATLTSAARCALASSIVTLQQQPTPHFTLRYRGPVSAWRGPLCYHFAGYNPTCRTLPDAWLTPATPLTFPAPGQVPTDLLSGYRLLLSAPQMFFETLRFDQLARGDNGWHAIAPDGWNCPAPKLPGR